MRLAVPRFVMLLISSCQHVQHCMGSVCRGPVFARGNAVVRVFFWKICMPAPKKLENCNHLDKLRKRKCQKTRFDSVHLELEWHNALELFFV